MIKNSQKCPPCGEAGVSLIITFFVMIIVLSIVLSVSVLLYSQIKVVRNMGNSVASYYAGESGIEKVLFYDRRVLPDPDDENSRGLCYMLDQDNTKYCAESSGNKDDSIACQNPDPGSCNPYACTNCTISFDTAFDFRTYHTGATVSADGSLKIGSAGEFNSTSRKVEINIIPNPD